MTNASHPPITAEQLVPTYLDAPMWQGMSRRPSRRSRDTPIIDIFARCIQVEAMLKKKSVRMMHAFSSRFCL